NMPYELERLQVGDVLFDGAGHTMIYVDRAPQPSAYEIVSEPMKKGAGWAFVHAYPGSGLVQHASHQTPKWFENDVYRCDDTARASVAAAYAKIWAANRTTAYSTGRQEKHPKYREGVEDQRNFGVEEERRRFAKEEEHEKGSGVPPLSSLTRCSVRSSGP